MRSTPAWYLPLTPRTLTPTVFAITAGFVLVTIRPTAVLTIGDGQTVPRNVIPFEYVPELVALTLCVGLAPRLDLWDKYGTRRTARFALWCALTTIIVPIFVFIACLGFYPRDGTPPARELLPLANNVMVVSCLAIITVGTLGRLLGALLCIAALAAMLQVQAQAPRLAGFLPVTFGHRADLSLDTDIKWVWLATLAALALGTAWHRRAVPLRVTLRSSEDR